MKNIDQLPKDLHRWFYQTKKYAKQEIAKSALDKATQKAPYETGFLSKQGYAFVDENLVKKSGFMEAAPNKTSIPPKGGYQSDITIVFRAGRPDDEYGVFDYAAYLGIYNPDWLKIASTKFWIESALDPKSFVVEINNAFKKALKDV